MKRIASYRNLRTAAIAFLATVWIAAAPAAFADEVIVVRDTTDIPDGIAGVQTHKATIGSEWGFPGTVFVSPFDGVLNSYSGIVVGIQVGGEEFTEAHWMTLTYTLHFWPSVDAYFASPSQGVWSSHVSSPSNSSWLDPVGTSHGGYTMHRFDFDISDAGLQVTAGQPHVIAFVCNATPLTNGKAYHIYSGGGFGQQPDVYSSWHGTLGYLGQIFDYDFLVSEVTITIPAPSVPGDLNGDGVVDGADLLILLSAWGTCRDCVPGEPGNCPADLTGDCNVDGADLLILLSNWG